MFHPGLAPRPAPAVASPKMAAESGVMTAFTS